MSEQSNVAYRPPQTAKEDPTRGDFMDPESIPPANFSYLGEFRHPLAKCHRKPPRAPMPKAPPRSSRMRPGQGSRVRSWRGGILSRKRSARREEGGKKRRRDEDEKEEAKRRGRGEHEEGPEQEVGENQKRGEGMRGRPWQGWGYTGMATRRERSSGEVRPGGKGKQEETQRRKVAAAR